MSNQSDDLVQLRREGNVAVVTLHNPKRRNAFSLEMKEGLIEAFTALNGDRECRAIVLTGTAGVFCAGGDMTQMARGSLIDNRRRMERSATLLRLIVSGPKPVLAAVEGFAVGAGLSLVTACDYVVMAANTRLSCAFIKVGLHPDCGGLWTLQRRVGPAKAAELVTLGMEIDGSEAGRIGIANRVVEPGHALPAALDVAGQYAGNPPIAFALIKTTLAKGSVALEDCLKSEVDLQPILMQTRDHAEAVAAFLGKRKPVFTGE